MAGERGACGAHGGDGAPVVAFFDADGTLLYREPEAGSETAPRPRVVRAVERFVAAGGIAVLSTGRSLVCVDEAVARLPFRGHVTMDGAYVDLDGQAVLDRCIPPAELARMVQEMCRVNMSAFFQGSDMCVALCPDGRNDYDVPGGACVSTCEEMLRIVPEPRFGKVDFHGIDYERYRQSDYLMRTFTYYDVGDGFHELVMRGVSKGEGARSLLAALGRECGGHLGRVFAFGDSENDLSLFEVADVAVAMGQAAANVRAAADYVTDTCADDGVATALEHFGLA